MMCPLQCYAAISRENYLPPCQLSAQGRWAESTSVGAGQEVRA